MYIWCAGACTDCGMFMAAVERERKGANARSG